MKKLLLPLIMIVALIGCSKTAPNATQPKEGDLPENAKVDTVILYDDIVVCETDHPENESNTYDVVMGMDRNPALAREYYRMLKIAEPSRKCIRVTFDDIESYYLVENWEGKIDTLSTLDLRGHYLTSEQRDNYLELLERANK